MITVGIDSGNKNTKAVALEDGRIAANCIILDPNLMQIWRR